MKKPYDPFLRVLVKRPGLPLRAEVVENTLRSMQELVDGPIECVTVTDDLSIVCNEEGRLRGLPENVDVCGYSFVGTIVFVGVRRGRFVSLDAAGIALAAKLCGGQKV